MRKRTTRTLIAALSGALLGGFVVFSMLVNLGKRSSGTPSPLSVPVGTFRVAASPDQDQEPSKSPEADPSLVALDALGVSFLLPDGYRVASALNAFDDSRPGPKRFTITKATAEQEEQYVALVQDLRSETVVEGAPEFVPGSTITVSKVSKASDQEERLAKETVPVTTSGGLLGTRYALVEGLNTYDVTYVSLGAEFLAVSMSYASEEPRFDDAAYQGVLDSLKQLDGGA